MLQSEIMVLVLRDTLRVVQEKITNNMTTENIKEIDTLITTILEKTKC